MYPIMVDLSQRRIVVFGGGKIATRKIRELLAGGGRPIVIAPEVTAQIQDWAELGAIMLKKRPFQTGDTQKADFIFICTNNSQINEKIQAETTLNQFVNNTTKKEYSSFFNMAVIRQKEIFLAISTLGKEPKQSKKLKEKLNDWLKENV